ncbi:hypothetical protein JL722_6921 [Aureococcus anophagefferens]|nr:hypothetical protein JL722_6921 [Aureococcus anophagefferens]
MASYDEALTKMYEERLTAFYGKYEPSKVAGVGALLAKYKGKEEQLLSAMVKKYGPEPTPEEAGGDDDDDDDEATDDEDPTVAPGKDGRADDDEDLEEEEDDDEPESDGEDKAPIYCPVNGLPPEYAEFGPDYEKSMEWIKANCPHLLPAGDDDAPGGAKKSGKRGGGILRKKAVAEEKQRVTIAVEFAASSSVKEKDSGGMEIVIQGDVSYDLPALLQKEYKIKKSKMFEKEKGGKLAPPQACDGLPERLHPGTFKYEVEFVSDDEDDARDDDDVVRAEIHFHDVLTEEYASYGVKLPVPWLRKATAKDLVDAFADEYARTRPERGAMGRLRLVTTLGAALEPGAARRRRPRRRDALVAPAAASFRPLPDAPGHERAGEDGAAAAEALGVWRCARCGSAALDWETRCWECGESRGGGDPGAADSGWRGDGRQLRARVPLVRTENYAA